MTKVNNDLAIPEFITNFFKSLDAVEISNLKSSGRQVRSFAIAAPAATALTSDEIKSICELRGIEFKKGFEARVLTYTCSDETVDRMGDVIKQDGWNLDNYEKNPVVMGFHAYNTFPVGTALKTYVSDGKLKMDILFADKETNEDADKAFRMAKSGFMRAGSVGFVPVESRSPNQKEMKELGMNPWGRVYDKSELLEFSVCGIPANPNAVQDMISKGIINVGELDGWMKKEQKRDLHEPEEKEEVVCESCGATVDYEKETEVKPGVINCPGCGAEINKSGKIVPAPAKEDDEAKSLLAELRAALTLVPAQKAGAVLSAKSQTALKDAMAALDGVYEASEKAYTALEELLKSAQPAPDGGLTTPKPSPAAVSADEGKEEKEFYVEAQRLLDQTLKSIQIKRSL